MYNGSDSNAAAHTRFTKPLEPRRTSHYPETHSIIHHLSPLTAGGAQGLGEDLAVSSRLADLQPCRTARHHLLQEFATCWEEVSDDSANNSPTGIVEHWQPSTRTMAFGSRIVPVSGLGPGSAPFMLLLKWHTID